MKIGQPTYSVGDLVKIRASNYYYWDGPRESVVSGSYGLVVGKTNSWYEAYEEARTDDRGGTRYWDNVNYSPYRVWICGTNDFEWISPEYMEPAYKDKKG